MDLANRHPPGVHGDDLVVEAGEAPFVFGDEDRFEATLSVAWDVDPERAVFGQYGLAADTVAVVADLARFLSAGRIAQVVAQFGSQRALDQRLLEGH